MSQLEDERIEIGCRREASKTVPNILVKHFGTEFTEGKVFAKAFCG